MPRSTKFQTVKLNLAGESDINRSLPVSCQRTVNLYPELTPGGAADAVLQSWPGMLAKNTGNSGADRGAHVFNGTTYQVSGTTLYSVASNGAKTSIGTISGTSHCSFANNGTTMVICNGSTPYSYDGTTLSSLTAITFNPKVVTYLNSQFIFDGDDGRFAVSDPSSTTVQATAYATPESDPDNFVAPHVFNQVLYLLSTNSIEPWDNTGVGSPPFERLNGGIIEDIGLASPYGVVNSERGMYFVAPDNNVYRVQSFQAEAVTNAAQAYTFSTYTVSDVIAQYVSFSGHKFIVFKFPTDKKTWVYDETSDAWFELTTGNDHGEYLGLTFVKNHGAWYVFAHDDGDVFVLDYDTFTNDGETLLRERTLAVLNGDTFGSPGISMRMSKLRLALETGTGTPSLDPQIMVQTSLNGGRTWGQEHWIYIGRNGEYNTRVVWDQMQVFKEMVIRIRMSDPAKLTLFSASLDVQEAGY